MQMIQISQSKDSQFKKTIHCEAGVIEGYSLNDELITLHSQDSSVLLSATTQSHTNASFSLNYEPFSGQTLQSYCQNKPLNLGDSLLIAILILEALNILHNDGAILGVITPESILISDDATAIKFILLLDPTQLLPETFSQFYKHLQPFTPPELHLPHFDAPDERTDYYLLGLILFGLITQDLTQSEFSNTAPIQFPAHIPTAIQHIIQKLVHFHPYDRYQSFVGIHYDLQYCHQLLQQHMAIPYFFPAKKDIPNRLLFTSFLYGRHDEKTKLETVYQSCQEKKTQLLIISGDSGIGKSSFVLGNQSTLPNAQFINGKFNEDESHPFGPIFQAFHDLIEKRLSDPKHGHLFKTALTGLPSGSLQFLRLFIPILQTTFPHLSNDALGDISHEKARFYFAIQQLITLIACVDSPLVLFLDDIQWAGTDTFDLLHHLLLDPNQFFMIILASRPINTETNTLSDPLRKLSHTPPASHHILLHPLDEKTIMDLLNDLFRNHQQDLSPLVSSIYKKTLGNPLFVKQLLQQLYDAHYIYFDTQNQSWVWSLKDVHAMALPDTIATLTTNNIGDLPSDAQFMLHIASFLGLSFSTAHLHQILHIDPIQCNLYLRLAEHKDLITCLNFDLHAPPFFSNEIIPDLAYQFNHDRIYRSFYELPFSVPQQQIDLHLNIARILYREYQAFSDPSLIFQISAHYQKSPLNSLHKDECLTAISIHLKAGQLAQSQTATEAAHHYFQVGIETLPQHHWDAHYQLSYDLYLALAQTAILNTQFTEAERLFGILHTHAKSPLDHASIYLNEVQLYINLSQYTLAISIGLKALRLLGCPLPKHIGNLSVLFVFIRTYFIIKPYSHSQLLHHHRMTDPERLLALDILFAMVPPAYLTNNEPLFGLLVLHMTQHSVTYGNSKISPFAYVLYGILLILAKKDFRTGRLFGDLALNLNEKDDDVPLRAMMTQYYAFFINNWHTHLREGIARYETSYQDCLIFGNTLYAGYALVNLCYKYTMIGLNLSKLNQRSQDYLQFLKKIETEDLSFSVLTTYTYTQSMRQKQVMPDLPFISDPKTAPVHRLWYAICQLFCCYLIDDIPTAFSLIPKANTIKKASFGTMNFSEYIFISTLVMIRSLPSLSLLTRFRYRRSVRKNLRYFNRISGICPDNFEHRYYFLLAEFTRYKGDHQTALTYYNTAHQSAKQFSFHNIQAMLAGRAASLCDDLGDTELANTYTESANLAFQLWGIPK